MLFKVPLMPMLIVSGAFLLTAGWLALLSPYASLLLAAVYFPLIAAMRAVTKKDDQRLRQLLMRLRRRFLRGHVRRRWGAYTYSPYRCKQRSQS